MEVPPVVILQFIQAGDPVGQLGDGAGAFPRGCAGVGGDALDVNSVFGDAFSLVDKPVLLPATLKDEDPPAL